MRSPLSIKAVLLFLPSQVLNQGQFKGQASQAISWEVLTQKGSKNINRNIEQSAESFFFFFFFLSLSGTPFRKEPM